MQTEFERQEISNKDFSKDVTIIFGNPTSIINSIQPQHEVKLVNSSGTVSTCYLFSTQIALLIKAKKYTNLSYEFIKIIESESLTTPQHGGSNNHGKLVATEETKSEGKSTENVEQLDEKTVP